MREGVNLSKMATAVAIQETIQKSQSSLNHESLKKKNYKISNIFGLMKYCFKCNNALFNQVVGGHGVE